MTQRMLGRVGWTAGASGLVLTAALAGASGVGANAALAGPHAISVHLAYSCRFQSGTWQVGVTIAATFPSAVGQIRPIQPTGVRSAVALPSSAVTDLAKLGAAQVAGSDVLTAGVTYGARRVSQPWPGQLAKPVPIPGVGHRCRAPRYPDLAGHSDVHRRWPRPYPDPSQGRRIPGQPGAPQGGLHPQPRSERHAGYRPSHGRQPAARRIAPAIPGHNPDSPRAGDPARLPGHSWKAPARMRGYKNQVPADRLWLHHRVRERQQAQRRDSSSASESAEASPGKYRRKRKHRTRTWRCHTKQYRPALLSRARGTTSSTEHLPGVRLRTHNSDSSRDGA